MGLCFCTVQWPIYALRLLPSSTCVGNDAVDKNLLLDADESGRFRSSFGPIFGPTPGAEVPFNKIPRDAPFTQRHFIGVPEDSNTNEVWVQYTFSARVNVGCVQIYQGLPGAT
eukprot:6186488-Pleurochrysis_carterae.AAC.1